MCVHSHTHMHTYTPPPLEYYSAIKKKEILSFVTTWMALEGIMLSEISDRERQTLHDLTYTWNLKNKTKQNQTHRPRERMDGYKKGKGARGQLK